MLASILRLEELLKCDFCDNLLRSTRTVNECGHRFCETCIYDRLGQDRQCPKCHIPAIVKNLRKDPMHDTMIACVKKLKHCVIESDLHSLSVPPFDSTNMDANNNNNNNNNSESQSQARSPPSSQRSTSFGSKTDLEKNITTEFTNPSLSSPFSFADQPIPNSYDSDATTLSSQQHLNDDTYRTTTTTITTVNIQPRAPSPPPPPKLLYTPSTDDLLLAMEDEEEIIDDDLSDTDIPIVTSTSTTPVITRMQNTTISSPVVSQQPQQQQQQQQLNNIYPSSDDLLTAMHSEEAMMDDDDDDDFSSPSVSNKSNYQHDILPTSHRRRLSSNISTDDQDQPTTKHQKVDPTSNQRIPFAIPYRPPLPTRQMDTNQQPLRWQCTVCFYKENQPDHLICGICRTKRSDDSPMISTNGTMNEPSISSTYGLSSLPSSFVVPSTITDESLQQQLKIGDEDYQYQDRRMVHMMVTSLTAEDDMKLDISMARAIDTCLKMEIYSDTRDLDNVTHLITSVNEQGLCTRTIKYLLCIMTGKWIVDTSWLIDSVLKGYWLPENKYQVIGDKTSGVTHGPERGRLRQQQEDDTVIPFFGDGDLRFFFYGEFPDGDTKLKLLQLVRHGGGKVISRRPSLDQLQQNDLVIIVSSLDETLQSRKKAHAWLKQCLHVKDSQWLLDSIARSKWVLN